MKTLTPATESDTARDIAMTHLMTRDELAFALLTTRAELRGTSRALTRVLWMTPLGCLLCTLLGVLSR